jgi:hypothetical protein
MRTKIQASLTQLSARFPPEIVDQWQTMIELWDEDHNNPNPYADPQSSQYRHGVDRDYATH